MIKADNKDRTEETEVIAAAEMDMDSFVVHTLEGSNDYLLGQCFTFYS
jgi:hypothetical protein